MRRELRRLTGRRRRRGRQWRYRIRLGEKVADLVLEFRDHRWRHHECELAR
jgi:hypothetical protein